MVRPSKPRPVFREHLPSSISRLSYTKKFIPYVRFFLGYGGLNRYGNRVGYYGGRGYGMDRFNEARDMFSNYRMNGSNGYYNVSIQGRQGGLFVCENGVNLVVENDTRSTLLCCDDD